MVMNGGAYIDHSAVKPEDNFQQCSDELRSKFLRKNISTRDDDLCLDVDQSLNKSEGRYAGD